MRAEWFVEAQMNCVGITVPDTEVAPLCAALESAYGAVPDGAAGELLAQLRGSPDPVRSGGGRYTVTLGLTEGCELLTALTLLSSPTDQSEELARCLVDALGLPDFSISVERSQLVISLDRHDAGDLFGELCDIEEHAETRLTAVRDLIMMLSGVHVSAGGDPDPKTIRLDHDQAEALLSDLIEEGVGPYTRGAARLRDQLYLAIRRKPGRPAIAALAFPTGPAPAGSASPSPIVSGGPPPTMTQRPAGPPERS